jgi:hypothetical protein
MMAIADPLVGTLFAASVAVVVGEGHAPVAAVLVPAVKADESIAAPKGRESRTPSLFPCKRATSWGDRDAGHDGDRGPL